MCTVMCNIIFVKISLVKYYRHIEIEKYLLETDIKVKLSVSVPASKTFKQYAVLQVLPFCLKEKVLRMLLDL